MTIQINEPLSYMSDAPAGSSSIPGASFFRFAAWYCLVVPCIAPVLGFVILVASGGRLDITLIATLCCVVSSFLLGSLSLFGAKKGVQGILWKALIGIAGSVVLGFLACVYLSNLKNWQG
jgi:hypothetical protein